MTSLDSVIAQHWASLIPAPAPVDPMHEAMDDYIAGMREQDSSATSSRPSSPTAAGNGGGR